MMNNEKPTIQDLDFQKIFEELQNQADMLFPTLQQEMKTFNDSHIAVESYQQYINALDQTPSAVTSNHIL